MASTKTYRILIAETAAIISQGLGQVIKKIKDFNTSVIDVDTRNSLFDTIASQHIDLVLVNPTFSGLLHPDEIRKNSLNQEIKIFAIGINKLNSSTLALYENHIHITDDLSEIKDKISKSMVPDMEFSEEKESLSLREKEIISHIVKGMTNQEIADKLYLSVHTVMTHRRNIARKLQIHSATGLTIYAIVNKIVDLSEVKL